jgi:hypothetical protein
MYAGFTNQSSSFTNKPFGNHGGLGGLGGLGSQSWQNWQNPSFGGDHGMQNQSHSQSQGHAFQQVYTPEPQRKSLISIDDVIIALQDAKDVKTRAEQELRHMQTSQPKPIDLNKSTTVYVVAHKAFATGNVWQPDTHLIHDRKHALFEMETLQRMNPSIEYHISELEWSLDTEKKKSIIQNFEWEIPVDVDEHDEEHVEHVEHEEHVHQVDPSLEKRFVRVNSSPQH